MIGAQVSVRPNASRNASMPYRSLNWSTMVLAVGAAIHRPELVVPVVVARRLLPGEVHHHADEVGDGDAGVAHVVDPPAGAELAADHRTAAGDDHRVDGHERRVAVEQRRGREVDVVGGEPGEADDDLRRRSTAARRASRRPWTGRSCRTCRRSRRGPGASASAAGRCRRARAPPRRRPPSRSHGAARPPCRESRPPVSMTQNRSTIRACSATATHRSACTSSMTA